MDAASLAREVNGRIYELVSRYDDDLEIDLLCECGCMAVTTHRLSDYTRHWKAMRPDHAHLVGLDAVLLDDREHVA